MRFKGSAGQSFGAWATDGMRLTLEGEANDYVGKGMCGGEIVLMPAAMAALRAARERDPRATPCSTAPPAVGCSPRGRAGERFAVRNSGAVAVVEGVGDHGCEYMTGGIVVVLGEVGRNFAAGMSNGVAYVLDPSEQLPSRYNPEMVQARRVMDADDLRQVYELVREHFEKTGSPRAAGRSSTSGTSTAASFWKVRRADGIAEPAAEQRRYADMPSEASLADERREIRWSLRLVDGDREPAIAARCSMTRHDRRRLLGLGVVGGGVARTLRDKAETIARRVGRPVALRGVLVRDPSRHARRRGLPLTTDPAEVLDDPESRSSSR